MRLVLDTNAYSAMMRGDDVVASIVRGAEEVIVPAVVIAELLYGFQLSARRGENEAQLRRFISEPWARFLPSSLDTCRRYAMVASALRKQGTPIPQNDIWVAAAALETGADLLSFDAHFRHVPGLELIHP